jgi:hypothetical protein
MAAVWRGCRIAVEYQRSHVADETEGALSSAPLATRRELLGSTGGDRASALDGE